VRPILSTYRLQLHAGFRLDDVRALIPYFAALGVTHLHFSPVLAARAGSRHNYDVTDPTRLNPALGTEAEFTALAAALRAAGLGIVLDIVPNHMAAHAENPFWEDVLTHGAASRHARWFDIEWRGGEPGPRPRIVLPVLGDLRVRALERGEITLRLRDGRIRVGYFEHEWPLDPLSLHPVLDAIADAAEAGGAGPEAAGTIRAHGRMLRALSRRRGRTAAEREHTARRADAAAAQVARLIGPHGTAARAAERALDAFAAPPDGARRLRRLLDAQAYRLVYWRRSARELNYRRFFDVNELVALHMEDPVVFAQTHGRVVEWAHAGVVDGFRVDHPDGLLDPLAYLRRLADEAYDWRPDARYPVWVEKILQPGETLPPAWPVSGTTGYDFLNEVEALFVDRAGLARLERDYRRLIRRPLTFALVAEEGKRSALRGGLSPGVRVLAARLVRLGGGVAIPVAAARNALVDVIAALAVYRTYADRHAPTGSAADRERLSAAVASARSRGGASPVALDRLEAVLLGGPWPDPEREQLRLRFVQRFQQLTGPAMAKGVEDTAFYAWVPLASLNEVGGAPDALPPDAVPAFHRTADARARAWPSAMLVTTTHDTKRSADVRSRLDVLSELPDEWEERLYRWRRLTRPLQRRDADVTAPDANMVYLFFQSLVGIWPVGQPIDEACRASLAGRLGEYMRKAAREAKERTSWLEPDPAYESALLEYVAAALDPVRSGPLLSEVGEFVRRIAPAGAWNAVARVVLQLSAPGIPDIYQGDELWNLALVDPDNRRPVEYARRQALLDDVIRSYAGGRPVPGELARMVARPWDGRLKLHVLHRLLAARRARPALFVGAAYEPLEVRGVAAGSAFAFARRAGDEELVVVVPRLVARRSAATGSAPVGNRFWEDTMVALPDALAGKSVECLLSARRVVLDAAHPVGDLLATLPVAVLATTPQE
jgi:(1->4)-alpha-D-glucan 1-alpha-D-glucosylmutase